MESAHDNHISADNTVSLSGWLIPVVLFLAVIIGFLSIVKACSKEPMGGDVKTEETAPAMMKDNEGKKEAAMPVDSSTKKEDTTATKTTTKE